MSLIQSIKDGQQTPPPGIVTLKLDGGQRWIEHFEPGRVRMRWKVDSAYFNLERAVICSWIACLADQAIFYATNTLLDEGDVTRVASLNLTYGEPVTHGELAIEAHVVSREGNMLVSECRFSIGKKTVALAAGVSHVLQSS